MIPHPSPASARLRTLGRTVGAMALTAFIAAGALLGGATAASADTTGDPYVIGTDTTFAPFEFTD